MTTKTDLGKPLGRGSRPIGLTPGAAPLKAIAGGRAGSGRLGVCELRTRAAAGGHLTATGEARTFRIDLGGKLAVTLEGPQGGDFDLYVKNGAPPTIEDYDLVGYSMRANEEMVIDSPESGDCYLMVRSYRGAGDFSLRVNRD